MAADFTLNGKDVFGSSVALLVGDPTIASGGGLIELGVPTRLELTTQFGRQMISNEGNQMLADGAIGWFKGAQAVITLFDAQAAKLKGLMPEITGTGDALEFDEKPKALVAPTLIIVPQTEVGTADTSDYVWYMPRALMTQDPGAFIYKLEETLAAGESFTVTLNALRGTEDQNSVALPAGKQILFRGGKPAGWSLPPDYVPGV